MPRFFINKEDITGQCATVRGEDSRHIARALRMAVGATVTLCDNEGADYTARLTKIRDEESSLEILESHPSEAESPAEITLFMSYPKSDKLEVIIQKAVELGASEIIPFESSRCIKKPEREGAKAEARVARLMRIAEEAAKQCGRGILPRVKPTITFGEVVKSVGDFDLPIFCYEGEGTESLKKILARGESPKKICIVVGCEGGFSPDEAASAKAAGFKMANLGPRILRCETAPDYCLAAISYKFEL